MSEKVYTENTKVKKEHYTYVYYDNGSGYKKEKAAAYAVDGTYGKVILSASDIAGAKEIRIDPVACASVIRIIRLEAETKDCFRKILPEDMTINGKLLAQGMAVFSSDAPQIVIPVAEKENWISVCFEFEVLCDDIAPLKGVFQAYEQELIQTIKTYEEKYLQLLANGQPMISQATDREQLMHDKLAYIQGTTVYRKLLKSKVDGLGLWNDLDI